MPDIHFTYGGSTATRTLNCSQWANLSKGMPRGKTSMAASKGTVGHHGFEKMVDKETYEFQDELGSVVSIDGNKVTIDQPLIDLVNTAVELQEDFFEEHGIEVVHTETLFTHSDLIGGSADTIAWSKERNLFMVGDLKTGSGHLVDAEDSDQLLFYAWLAVSHFAKDFTFDGNTRILLYILQPVDRKAVPLDVWEVNVGDLIAFGKAFKLAVRVAESGLADPVAGDWCQYCPAAAVCPAKVALVNEGSRLMTDTGNIEALARGMAIVGQVEEWCRDVRKLAHEQLEAGADVPGWKLVNKRATRVWNDAEAINDIFHRAKSLKMEDYMDMKLKTPPAMEKVCKAKKLDFKKYAEHVSSVSSGTTLAPADDKREAALPLDSLASAVAQLT